MIEDLSDYPSNFSFDADVAIVGAGAAGITLARRLAQAQIRVCLLESGGRDYEQKVQDLAKGTNIGFPYYPLDESRLRFFGGTTAIWGGRSAELDPIDFQRRSWVTDSGWPFDKETLAPYYQRAMTLLDLPGDQAGGSKTDPKNLHGLAFDRSQIETSHWWFDDRSERFAINNCADLSASAITQILLHATVIGIVPNASGTAVETLKIANLKGGQGTVRAKAFVLAAGGIETPRLLLAQAGENGHALGNEHDLVGRYFAEHPRARGGLVISERIWPLIRAMPRLQRAKGRLRAAILRGSDQLQREEGILNTGFSLAVRKPPGTNMSVSQRIYTGFKHRLPPDRVGRWFWQRWRRGHILAREMLGLPRSLARLKSGGYGLFAVIRGEQAPNPASRLMLDNERDALGMPRIKLDWRFSEIETHTVRVLMSTFDQELKRLGLGTLEPSDWLQEEGAQSWQNDAQLGNHHIAGYHHMGTTRMATDPRHGVVDANSRVHGTGNLYIAGSSVFPTSGWANPTLTILAMTLRLADHLVEPGRLGR